ncbi:phage portal protein [Pseudooceanicola sp. CBS1P-1]|uniref:Phage portal protein n=1 Tax=Pseudooceanicola albus TaxID=2692189 RepID=A0A6L7GC83_9RHOB|nr:MULTISPECIES: phage portal protein [Pseudooceanicola]MBT9386976.1 phage portal protein [Pseudooceanicola endophyticus]MXN21158.1 phage portal protein [Pseudooceanicola albus]
MARKTDTGFRPSLLDRTIAHVLPERGLRRIRAKAQLSVMMNYDAASRGRRTSGWRAPLSSADAAGWQAGARAQLRNLSRDFVRNRPFAARAVSVITGNVVGSGILPSISHDDPDRKARVDQLVRDHLLTVAIDAMGQHALPGLQRAAMNAVVEDGEVLVRRRWRVGPYGAGLALPFQVELLEADYLDQTKVANGQNEIVEGVEYGPTGAVVAYHILRQHPGAASRRLALDSVRVPAADVLHIRRADRPGQVRGISWFAPVMLTLGDMSDYQEGEILKQKIAALLAAFVSSEEPIAGDALDPDQGARDLGLGEMGPGTITELPPGKSVSFTTPPQMPGGYDQFMRQNLSAVAMGLGLTYESLAGDLSRVNFSSARMGRMEMDRNIETWQQLLMIDQFCRGIERWLREAWTMRPRLGPADFAVTWTAPRRALIDPTKEVPALVAEMEAGITSRQRVQRQLGLDPAVVLRERVEDAQAQAGQPVNLTNDEAAPGDAMRALSGIAAAEAIEGAEDAD